MAQEIVAESWSDFETRSRSMCGDKVSASGYPWLFRGLGNSCWALETTLEHHYPAKWSLLSYYKRVLAAKPAIEAFSGRRWRVPDLPALEESIRKTIETCKSPHQVLTKLPDVYEYLVYLRHHGFPSPLLDWTASPYVAAFFAFDEVAKNTDRVCVYAAKGLFSGNAEFFELVGPHMTTHERHFLQQGWYSYSVKMNPPSADWVFWPHEQVIAADSGKPVHDRLLKFTIPASERRLVLQHLDLMNINPFSLFKSEDSLVRTTARRECGYSETF
jgi:hypothetical protein